MPGSGGRGAWSWGGAWSRRVPGPGGSALGVPGGDPPGWLLLWAVRILLECIVVKIAKGYMGEHIRIKAMLFLK